MHDNVHCQIGATMCTREAASALEFFLHHTFIDNIWDDWQKKSSAHKNAYFPTVRDYMPETSLRPAQLIDLSNQPGGVSIEYEPFEPEEEIRKKVAGKKPFMHLGLCIRDTFKWASIPTTQLLHCYFPSFPSLYLFSFFFLSSVLSCSFLSFVLVFFLSFSLSFFLYWLSLLNFQFVSRVCPSVPLQWMQCYVLAFLGSVKD